MQVTLDQSELERVIEIACKMNDLAFDKNIDQKPYCAHETRDSMLRIRINGCAAKAAFAKLFDCSYNPAIGSGGRYTGRGESIYDFIVHGFTVKVSATQYPNGKLIGHPDHAHNPPDYLALMVGTYPHFVLKGFMEGRELFRKARYVACFGSTGRPAYIASQDELSDLP